MQPRTSGLRATRSAVQIIVAQMVGVWSLASLVMSIWNTVSPGSFGQTRLSGWGNGVWFLIGLFLIGWALHEVWVPRVKENEAFCSTHPSYLLLDSVPVLVSGLLCWYGKDSQADTRPFALMLALSCLFPIARVTA